MPPAMIVWLTIWTPAPISPAWLREARPTRMKPMWEIDE